MVHLHLAVESFSSCEVLLSPFDWKINEDTIVEPDLMVICYFLGDVLFLEKPPELVVEILSPHNREKDLVTKFDLYRKQKVKYYLVVDADKKEVTIFEYKNDSYQKVGELSMDSFDFELSACNFSLDFSRIWPDF